jgi:hypothetical protein
MMKGWLVLGLVVVALVIFSGCTPERLSCIDDGFCSPDEKYIGTCGDCKPDFVVESQDMYASYNASTGMIDASVCVKNTNGGYEGDVSVGWFACASKDCKPSYETEIASFSPPAVESHPYLAVRKGQAIFSSQLVDAKEQHSCFSKQFTVQPSGDYWVHFMINEDQKVAELKFDNNYATYSLKSAAEHYPDILLEYKLGIRGEIAYLDSGLRRLQETMSSKPYNIGVYAAHYAPALVPASAAPSDGNPEVAADNSYASIGVFESEGLAKSYLEGFLVSTAGMRMNLSKTKLSNNAAVYLSNKGDHRSYFWQSGNKIVYVEDSEREGYAVGSEPLASAYSARYYPEGSQPPRGCGGEGLVEFEFKLKNGSMVSDALTDGQTRSYTIGGTDYEITAIFISVEAVPKTKLAVNGLSTKELPAGTRYQSFGDGSQVYIREILSTTEDAEAKFYINSAGGMRAVSDSIKMNETKSYTIDGKVYEFKAVFISGPEYKSVKFSVNGELQRSISEGSEQLVKIAGSTLGIGVSSVSVCTPMCGNGLIDLGEDCDTVVAKKCSDMSYGGAMYTGGVLKCINCHYDTTGCTR